MGHMRHPTDQDDTLARASDLLPSSKDFELFKYSTFKSKHSEIGKWEVMFYSSLCGSVDIMTKYFDTCRGSFPYCDL